MSCRGSVVIDWCAALPTRLIDDVLVLLASRLAGVEAPDLRGGAGIVRFTSRANTTSVRTAVVVSSGSAHHDWAPLVTAPPLSASTSGELHSVLLLDAAVILRNVTMRRFAWKAAQVHVSGPLVARALVHLNDDGAAEEWPPVSLENVLATTALSADPLADRNTDIRLVSLLSGYVLSVGCACAHPAHYCCRVAQTG